MHTQSVLTITSNVVYGKHTGNTPDGRAQGRAVRPRRQSVERQGQARRAGGRCCRWRRFPTTTAEDGISLTLSVVPTALGTQEERFDRGVGALDAYFASQGFHVNINVLNRETLLDAMEHPEKYPQLTIRVSGYAVNFVKLTQGAAAGRDQPHLPRQRC